MANIDNKKLIKIWGVTLPESKFMVRSYGYGIDDVEIEGKEHRISYVDYYIDDLVALIKKQELEKVFIKKLEGGNKKIWQTKKKETNTTKN